MSLSIVASVLFGTLPVGQPDVGLELHPVSAGTRFERWEVSADGSATAAAAGEERLIYSNTFGNIAAATGASLVVDDIALVSGPTGCRVRRYEFPVLGKINPAGTGGPFTVEFGLYSNCPGSSPALNLLIPGTNGSVGFPNDAPRMVIFALPEPGIVVPSNNVWFGVKFSRSNAGIVVGAPAEAGVSCDLFDFPGFPCRGALGGFPERPHASFNLKLFGDAATCTDTFAGYKNNMASGVVVNPGANRWLVDDIKLGVPGCQMTAYEVAVRGVGFYEFEMRRECEGDVIGGTGKFGIITQGTDARVFRFEVSPPVGLPNAFHFATKIINDTAGIITAGQQACIGETGDCYGVPGYNPECTEVCPGPPPSVLPPGIHGGVNLTITCAGQPAVGACCDMYFPQCVGGADDGKLCCPENADGGAFCYEDPLRVDFYPPCAAPGMCESVCRDVAPMNCPWPSRVVPSWSPYFGVDLQPPWTQGATCDSDPFPHACGVAACCRPDDVCENLTVNQCYAVEPVGAPRQWQQGRYCGFDGQRCPFAACIFVPGRTGDCSMTHEEPGCWEPLCCDSVCRIDDWCCDVEWDRGCAQLAADMCSLMRPPNDECAASHGRGAVLVEADSSTFFSNAAATESKYGEWFCLAEGEISTLGVGTMWFKFVATDASATISTINSEPAGDSLVQVFAANDATNDETACATLQPIDCGDDVRGCEVMSNHARFCVRGLVPGNVHYVVVASKGRYDKGSHQLEILSPCTAGTDDCDADGILDECEPDCNHNDRPDVCEILDGQRADCNSNLVPDECDPDCNDSGSPDDCDIASGLSLDCDANGLPDECLADLLRLEPHSRYGNFGYAVALDRDLAVVGDPGSYANSQGAVHVFRRYGESWIEEAAWTSPQEGGDAFGFSVAVYGNLVLVGAPSHDHEGEPDAGAAYVFEYDGSSWGLGTKLLEPRPGPERYFGWAVALQRYWAIISAPTRPFSSYGTVYVFGRSGDRWFNDGEIPDPNPLSLTRFGMSLDVDDERIVVGSPNHYGGSAEGRIYIFRPYDGVIWIAEATIINPDPELRYTFGTKVALEQDLLAIGAPGELYYDPCCGAIHVFRRTDDVWIEEAQLEFDKGDPPPGLGRSVSLFDGIIAAAPAEARADEPILYLFERTGTDWAKTVEWFDADARDGLAVSAGESGILVGGSGFADVFPYRKRDCNANQVPDTCDIEAGNAVDCNINESPDECDALPPADFDFDKDVDLEDIAALQRCWTGAGGLMGERCCVRFDLEARDGDVDAVDYAGIWALVTGP